jgi:hypothetical protein
MNVGESFLGRSFARRHPQGRQSHHTSRESVQSTAPAFSPDRVRSAGQRKRLVRGICGSLIRPEATGAQVAYWLQAISHTRALHSQIPRPRSADTSRLFRPNPRKLRVLSGCSTMAHDLNKSDAGRWTPVILPLRPAAYFLVSRNFHPFEELTKIMSLRLCCASGVSTGVTAAMPSPTGSLTSQIPQATTAAWMSS